MEAAERSDNFRGGINYYRAAMRRNPFQMERGFKPIERDVLVLWGDKDPALGSNLAAPGDGYVPHLRMRRFEDAGHWVHLDDPSGTNQELIDFLTS